MTRKTAKSIVMPILDRIRKKSPVMGYLAEVAGDKKLFTTMDAARNWIHCHPLWAHCDANEMPTISYGWYVNVIMRIP